MDLLTLTLSKSKLLTGISMIGLAGITYFTNRYMKNIELTTNKTYYKPFEVISNMNMNMNMNTISKDIIYLFWNGDIASTYLLIDLLLQDKIIQPIYFERYSIIKQLEQDKLMNITQNIKTNYKTNYKTNNMNNKYNDNKYLQSISALKKSQDYEVNQLEILRLMILAQYPEFKYNLLPTTYILTIAKDLEYTSKFYNILQELHPIYTDGIEFIEQIIRFLKYYDKIKKNTQHNTSIRIILACSKDYKHRELLSKLIKKNIISIEDKILGITIDMPVIDMDNKTIKFMAVEFFPNDIMKYFLQIEKDTLN